MTGAPPAGAAGQRVGHTRVIVLLGVAQALTLAFGLVRWKVAAIMLGPAGLGTVSVIEQIGQVAVKLGSLSLPTVALRFFAIAREQGRQAFAGLSRRFVQIILVGTAVAAALAALVLLRWPSLTSYALRGRTLAVCMALAAVPFLGSTALLKSALASLGHYLDAAVIGVLGAIALVGVTYLGIRFDGIQGLYIGVLITSIAVFAAMQAGVRLRAPARNAAAPGRAPGLRLSELTMSHGPMVRLAASMYTVSCTSALVYSVTRLQVLREYGEIQTGHLAAILAIATSVRLVLGEASLQYLIPAVSRPKSSADRAAEVAAFAKNLAVLLLGVGLIVVMFPREMLLLLYSSSFTRAAPYLGVFVLAESTAVIADTFRVLLIGFDDPLGYMVGMVSGHAVTIVGVLIFVPAYGMLAAGLSHLAGALTILIACFMRLRVRHGVTSDRRSLTVVSYSLASLALGYVVGRAVPTPGLSAWGVKGAVGAALGFGALMLVSKEDRAALRALLGTWLPGARRADPVMHRMDAAPPALASAVPGPTEVMGGPSTPFFVMGCRRSGTTLVSQILDSHSRLAAYHESYFYPIFRPELRWYGDLRDRRALDRLIADVREVLRMQGADPPSADALVAAMPAPTMEGLLASVLHLYAISCGKARGGDKTPEHYVFLDELLEQFPQSPVLFLVRDPRDVILSIQKAFGVKVEDGAHSWNQAFLSQQRTSRPVHVVRYEELVQSPVSGVEAICAFMGEAFEPVMLSFHERIPERFRNRPGGGRLERPVNAESVGRFREMSASDIARIELLCGEGMEEMGYRFVGRRPAFKPARSETPVARSLLARALERLRYYGVNGERWRRGIWRWGLMLRVRIHYLVGLVMGRAQAPRDR